MASRKNQVRPVERQPSPSTRPPKSKRKIASLSDSDGEEVEADVPFEIESIFPFLEEAKVERALTDNLEEPKDYLIHEAAIVKLIRQVVHLETAPLRDIARTYQNRLKFQKELVDIEWEQRMEALRMYHAQQKYIEVLEEIMTYHNIALPDRPVEEQ